MGCFSMTTKPSVQGMNIPHFDYQCCTSNHPLSLSIGTRNLLPRSYLDQLSLHFLGEELTAPRSPPLASLSDPSWRCCSPPSRELFQSLSLWISHQSSSWLLTAGGISSCFLSFTSRDSRVPSVPTVPISIAEVSAPPERNPLPILPALLVCPIHPGGQVTHLHQETSFTHPQ